MAEGRSPTALAFALGLTLLFAVVEVAIGFIANSLSLISDAGHMVTDAASLGLVTSMLPARHGIDHVTLQPEAHD